MFTRVNITKFSRQYRSIHKYMYIGLRTVNKSTWWVLCIHRYAMDWLIDWLIDCCWCVHTKRVISTYVPRADGNPSHLSGYTAVSFSSNCGAIFKTLPTKTWTVNSLQRNGSEFLDNNFNLLGWRSTARSITATELHKFCADSILAVGDVCFKQRIEVSVPIGVDLCRGGSRVSGVLGSWSSCPPLDPSLGGPKF